MTTAIATQLAFTTNTVLLATELRLASKVIANKIAIPVLGNVLFRAKADTLTLEATDLELAYRTSVVAVINAPGAVTLPAAKLLQILDQLPNGDISIVVDEKGHVNLSSGAFKSRLQALPADDFPTLPEVNGDMTTFSAVTLRELIYKTSYAVDDPLNSKRKMAQLTGALFRLNPEDSGQMQVIATDGNRLAFAWAEYAGTSMPDIILPKRTLKVLNEQTYVGDIEFSKDDNHLFFKMGSRLLTSRMLEGQYPNWQRVIPTNDKKASIDRAALLAIIKRVSLVAEQNQSIYLVFGDGTLTVTASSAEIGQADEQMPITYSDGPLSICCGWQYVQDFLEHAESPVIELSVKSDILPMLFSDGAFQCVVMPKRA